MSPNQARQPELRPTRNNELLRMAAVERYETVMKGVDNAEVGGNVSAENAAKAAYNTHHASLAQMGAQAPEYYTQQPAAAQEAQPVSTDYPQPASFEAARQQRAEQAPAQANAAPSPQQREELDRAERIRMIQENLRQIYGKAA